MIKLPITDDSDNAYLRRKVHQVIDGLSHEVCGCTCLLCGGFVEKDNS
ncbi:MAG TPA: hypothetical protein IGS40_20270 [Trichormus sp. M33_DOE_039]|nr:hypothetical protein [Trichormus sp. M33_DOE_039]